jgi:uncharacterized protein (DUF1330 family)
VPEINNTTERQERHMTAYVVAQTTLTNQEKYQKEFIPASMRSHEVHHVEIVVRTGAIEAVAGQAPERMVILKFRDLAHARSWYESPEVREILRIAKECTKNMTVLMVPGFEDK